MMKRVVKPSIVIALIMMMLISASYMGSTAHHNSETLTGKIHAFYAQMRAGNFDEAFDHILLGGSGYTADGLLKEIPNQEVKSMIMGMYSSAYEKGIRLSLFPKHIQIKEFGNTAIATLYVDGDIIENGERKNVTSRGTLVWVNQDDDWKIAHWHISDVNNDND